MNTKTEKTIQELELEAEVNSNISDVKWFDIPVLAIFFILFVIVALQFITRYIMNDSLAWTEEVARYILILLCFVGSISCVRKSKHIFLEFFYRYLSPRSVKAIVLIVEILVAGFFAFLSFLSFELGRETTQNMVSLNVAKSTVYYIIAVACLITVFFAVLNIINYTRSSAKTIYSNKLNIKE